VKISFNPIDVTIVSGRNLNSPRIFLGGAGIKNNSYKGEWIITGDVYRFESTQAGGVYVPKENNPSILIYGKENGTVNAKWTVSYGSVSFSDTITLKTGDYLEYEALVDLQLTDLPSRYKMEDGHVVFINLGGLGTGWMFGDFNENPTLRSLKYLRKLLLSGTGTNYFPTEIPTYLKNLTYLDMSGNFIDQMPDNIGELKKLDTLIIDNQQDSHEIKQIPESFGGLESLKYFKMSSVLIDLPSSFGNLHNLEKLEFIGSSLNSIPECFGNLASLKYFWVNGFYGNLPESFGRLTNLREMSVADCHLTKLPDSIGNLKKLYKIYLHGPENKIETLPAGICDIDSLKELDLVSLPLKELPVNLGNLKSLESLRLYTSLSSLPQSICGLSGLKALSVEGPKNTDVVFTIPDNITELTNLEVLRISGQNLHSLPSDIGKLSKMRFLDLPNCELDSIPSSVSEFKNLYSLNLGGNNLTSIPLSFKNLKGVSEFQLQQNPGLAWQIDEIRSWGICSYLTY
jgi:Leucine-rich repeat (LRR) protein